MVLCLHPVFRAVALAAAILAASGIAPAAARDRHDHDAAREAVEAGEIRPLAEILRIIRGKLPGEIVGVEIERRNGRWLYEFRVVDGKGGLFEVYVDARTGDVERIREK